jgi:hypothetical protein
MKDEVSVVWMPVTEGETVPLSAGVESGNGDNEFDVVVIDVSEGLLCCSAPKQRKGRRVNTVLIRFQFGAIIAFATVIT